MIAEYGSITEAAQATGLAHTSQIAGVCAGVEREQTGKPGVPHSKTTHGGKYTWRYTDEFDVADLKLSATSRVGEIKHRGHPIVQHDTETFDIVGVY